MTVHRYSVLDADGIKINTITADDGLLKTDWYPGYGTYLIDDGEVPPDPPPPPPPTKPDTWGVPLDVKLATPMQNGDKLDIKSGAVTLAADLVQIEPVLIDPIAEPPMPMPVELAKP